MTSEEIKRPDAAYKKRRVPVLTLGLIPKPEPKREAGS